MTRGGKNGSAEAKAPVPWFVLGFVALVGLNSVLSLPAPMKADVNLATTFLLSMALAAMGLETDIAKLSARGIRPFLLGAIATLFIAGFSLLLVKLTS
jgi:uncharacterized membrane protein YadS